LRTLLWILIGGPVAIIVMALAVVNNQPVTIAFDPFTPATPFFSLTVPLYVVFFVALMLGILLGGMGAWARQGRFRRAARQNRKEAARWRVEAERLRGDQPPPAGPALPAPRRAA
jgi:uncharacterized integral membrane protein